MDDNNNTDENPYAAPPIDADLAMANVPSEPDPSLDEQIRAQYISHEAEIRSISALWFLGGVICGIIALFSIIGFSISLGASNPYRADFPEVMYSFAGMIIFGTLTVVFFGTGLGLHRLRPWSRISSGILSALGLLLFPVGTLVGFYLLYLLLSSKAKFIFSDEYREIFARTQHMKYKTPLLVKIIVGALLVVFLLGILFVTLQSR